MGATKLHSRSILRNLVKTEITATYMNDVGRQRVTKYVSKKFEKNSKMSKQFNKEIHKIKELTKEIINENEKKLKKKATENEENSSMQYENDQTNQKLHSDNHHKIDKIDVEASIINKNENEDKKDENEDKDKDKDAHRAKKDIILKNKFHLVNRILYKYQMLGFISKYKCTSSQSLLLKMKNSKADVKRQESESNVSSTSLQQIANNAKTTSLYNSIKMNLTMQKSIRTEKGVNEVFGFMDIVQNNEKSNSSNITYRYCTNHINDRRI